MITETIVSFVSLAVKLKVLFIGISFFLNLLQAFIPYRKAEAKLKNTNLFLPV